MKDPNKLEFNKNCWLRAGTFASGIPSLHPTRTCQPVFDRLGAPCTEAVFRLLTRKAGLGCLHSSSEGVNVVGYDDVWVSV